MMNDILAQSYQFDNDYAVRVSTTEGSGMTFASMTAAYEAVGAETMDAIRDGIHSEFSMQYVIPSEVTK